MNSYIDIHSHFLPGFDDGPENFDQCIETARRYRALGIGTIIATPHWIRSTGWVPSPAKILRAAKKVEFDLELAGVPLKIIPGMEIGYSSYFKQDMSQYRLLPLGLSEYFLVEFPLYMPAEDLVKHFMSLLTGKNMKIIVAHPERCAVFQNNTCLLQRLVNKGILVQVTIDSLLGVFGIKIQETALDFLNSGLVHFLATDSHGRGGRMPPDIDCWNMLVDLLGNEGVTQACSENPRQMLEGKPVEPLSANVAGSGSSLSELFSEKTNDNSKFNNDSGLLKKLINTLKKNM